MPILPKEFVERMGQQLGKELPDFLLALEQEPVRGIRMNDAKPFDGMEHYMSGERVPWTSDGYLISHGNPAGSTIFHEAGGFYLQDPAAMLPAEVLNAQPGEKILDLCAAPGGKSTQIGLKLLGDGLLVCNEPIPKRAIVLSRNIERMGITNSIVISAYPESIPYSWDNTFDGVLVDAPCSGEGMFRREPETRCEWTLQKAKGCAERQRRILDNSARFVRPGGHLVYSTCTYNPEENELAVLEFIKKHPEFYPEPFSFPEAEGKNGMLLLLPNRIKGEGQFVANLRKKGGTGKNSKMCIPFVHPAETILRRFREQFGYLQQPNATFGNMLVHVPECPDLKGMRVLRAGYHLAEMRGEYLIPAHSAALANSRYTGPETEIDAQSASDYIAGKEISGNVKGWTVMKYRGLRIGWGKGSNSTIKNHYPKGLRKERIITNPKGVL